MDIFTRDLIWNNYLPLNKLLLRQIAETKRIEELETANKGRLHNIFVAPLFKYLNYKGGIPTKACATLTFREIEETLMIDRYLEKLETELLVSKLGMKRPGKLIDNSKFISISEEFDGKLIEEK